MAPPTAPASGLESKVEEILDVLGKLLIKTNNIESSLSDKADRADLDTLATRVTLLEDKLDQHCVGFINQDYPDCSANDRKEARIDDLEVRMLKQEQDLQRKLSEIEIEQVKMKQDSQARNDTVHQESTVVTIQQAVQAGIDKKIEEDKDQENRKRNIIVYRVPEKKI